MSEEDSKPLNVGIIGTGFGSVVQYPGFKQHSGFNPVAISGRHESKTKTIANKLGIDNYHTDWLKVVENPEIDIVSIATPPHLHKEMAITAFEQEKHVLCEKPLGLNTQEVIVMKEMAEEHGLISMTDLEFRFIPARAYLVELINSGFLGEIYQIDISVRNSSRLNPRTKGYNWWSDLSKGGGVLNALGTHYIDFLLMIFDEIQSVSGTTGIHIPKRLNKITGKMKEVTADDSFSANFAVDNDALVSMKISSTTPFGRGPKIEAYGSEGAIIMLEDQTLIGGKIGEDDKLKPMQIPNQHKLPKIENDHILLPPFIRLLDEFNKSIRSGRSLHPNFEDGLKIQKVLDAIRESDKKDEWISIKQK